MRLGAVALALALLAGPAVATTPPAGPVMSVRGAPGGFAGPGTPGTVGFVLRTRPLSDGTRHHLNAVILALQINGLVYLNGDADDLRYAGPPMDGAPGLCAQEKPLGAALSELGWSCSIAIPTRPMAMPPR